MAFELNTRNSDGDIHEWWANFEIFQYKNSTDDEYLRIMNPGLKAYNARILYGLTDFEIIQFENEVDASRFILDWS